MEIDCHKYSGTGNDFVLVDGRDYDSHLPLDASSVASLCAQYATDGLMVLESSALCDFSMKYYNPDGSTGMMCGNGGRCITAFAADLGVAPAAGGGRYVFEGPDGVHTAEILPGESLTRVIRLGMRDVREVIAVDGGYFLDTGARHFVVFVDDVEAVDVGKEGARLRHLETFAPEGANVDFVCPAGEGILKVRTFEKGVEAETLACGTGIVASAVAAYYRGLAPVTAGGGLHYIVRARKDDLSVDFCPSDTAAATSVFLTGPVNRIF